jgi:hypothetical protein
VLLRVQVVFGSNARGQLFETRANAAQKAAERAQYKGWHFGSFGRGGRLSCAALLRPEATHNTFKKTCANFLFASVLQSR